MILTYSYRVTFQKHDDMNKGDISQKLKEIGEASIFIALKIFETGGGMANEDLLKYIIETQVTVNFLKN